MLVSLNWLKEYVKIDHNPKDFGDILTMSGTKVETIDPICDVVDGVIAGKIMKIEKHPDADKLVVCRMNIGKEELLTIVTSAKNVFEGAVVPVAVEGSVIANGQKMERTEFRGIISYGMMCSVEELGMNTDLFSKEIQNGIYILPNDTEPGISVKKLLWIDDSIIDIELTANRGDCQSIYGVARETAAALNEKLSDIALYTKKETQNDIENWLSVKVESDLCPRYVAKMFKVKKIEPSPLWMQIKLLNSGVRPINNIVDVTNYVMLELGQPLHSFDYKSLNSKEIVVKTTSTDKTVVTLDDKERTIDETMLMITNGIYPVAVAGVMGGANSEIAETTEYVVLESACFDKTNIRLTSKKLGLRTEASARYEKGIYPNLAETAALRATYLFDKIGACDVIEGMIDVYHHPAEMKEITVDINWINRFIGIQLSRNEITSLLERLFLTVKPIGNSELLVKIPDYRQDLEIREDLAEEVARLYGYNNIPSTIMGGTTLVGGKTPSKKYEELLQNLLIGAGYYQTLTSSFTSSKRINGLNMDHSDELIPLINPLGEENSIMRNTLMGHQLEIISLNDNRKNPFGRFFEFAQTYHKNSNPEELPIEKKHLTLSGYGKGMDYFELKGIIELLFEKSGITNYDFIAGGSDLYHPGRKALIMISGEMIGEIGEIHPIVVKNYDLPKRTYACELDFNALFKSSNLAIKFSEMPKYPESSRDIALVLNETIPASKIDALIKKHDTGIIEKVELFDVYQGEQISAGQKSLAYSIIFRHPDRTLTDEDINPIMDKILSDLKTTFDAQLRD
ncbi:MAG: phenylalanine--tRNA ligase subunit beta [Eubacterium sp.]